MAAIPMKTKKEMKQDEQIAALRKQIEDLRNSTEGKALIAQAEMSDFHPNLSAKRAARPNRRHNLTVEYGNGVMTDAVKKYSYDLVEWLSAIAQPGERITLTVMW